jgi:hypothetical protein
MLIDTSQTPSDHDRSKISRFVAGFLALSMFFVLSSSAATAASSPPIARLGVQQKGYVIPTIACTSTGIKWGGATRAFVGSTEITYHWVITINGGVLITGSHGGYFTDRFGSHDRLPAGFPQAVDCGPGLYTIGMSVDGINAGKYYYTPTATASVAC